MASELADAAKKLNSKQQYWCSYLRHIPKLTLAVNGANGVGNHAEPRSIDAQSADRGNDDSDEEKDDDPSAGADGGKLASAVTHDPRI